MFAQTAEAFDNPDFVEVVIYSYRHRFGGIPGDPALNGIEALLAAQPHVTVPAIVLEGEDDGVSPPQAEDSDAHRFTGPYERRIVPGARHNFPQEASNLFAEAVSDPRADMTALRPSESGVLVRYGENAGGVGTRGIN